MLPYEIRVWLPRTQVTSAETLNEPVFVAEKKVLINESNYWPNKNNHTSSGFFLVSKYVTLKYRTNSLNCRTVQRLQKTQASPQFGGKFQQLFGTARTCKEILLHILFAERANKYY